jgi:hypothetical protein
MNLLNKTANPSGAYPPIFTSDKLIPGCAVVPDDLRNTFQQYNGFVIPAYDGDAVVHFVPNIEAWEAWKAIPVPEPPLDELTQLRLALAELAEAQEADQTATELALAELAEIMTGGLT